MLDDAISQVGVMEVKVETLRQSTLKKAFSGQLVSQASNDELASELLVRTQAEKAAWLNPSRLCPVTGKEKKIKQTHKARKIT